MKKMSMAWKAILIALATAVVAGALVMVGCSCSSSASSSASGSSSAGSASDVLTVPNVVSLTQADADKALAASGFSIGTVTQEASDTVPTGSVIKQDPQPFTSAPAGTAVNLVISSGKAAPKDVQVPDLKGKTQADAEKALSDVGLVGVASNPEVSTDVAPGQVFKQSVAAGTTVKEGTKVAFTVAQAPGEATVPDVTGMKKDDAKAAITGASLGFDYTVAYSDTVPEGSVISQSIPAGTKVQIGTTISIQVSLGAKPAQDVQVPDVTTFSWSDAEAALKGAGLQARYTGDPAGVVVSQDVAAGTMVAPGTLVTVTLASPVENVQVPDLVGMSVTAAEAVTDGMQLSLDIVQGSHIGVIQEQWPDAGTTVPVRTTINVVVLDTNNPDMSGQSDSGSASSASSDAPQESSGSADASGSSPAAPDASAFIGPWQADRASLDIADKGGKIQCTISWGSSADETTTWEYVCVLDNGKLVAKGTGVKSTNGNPEYKDGSATFSLDDSGSVIWKDEKEDAGNGLKFMRM